MGMLVTNWHGYQLAVYRNEFLVEKLAGFIDDYVGWRNSPVCGGYIFIILETDYTFLYPKSIRLHVLTTALPLSSQYEIAFSPESINDVVLTPFGEPVLPGGHAACRYSTGVINFND